MEGLGYQLSLRSVNNDDWLGVYQQIRLEIYRACGNRLDLPCLNDLTDEIGALT